MGEGIDWANTPLEDFSGVYEYKPDGSIASYQRRPFGKGKAQRIMIKVQRHIEDAYEELMGEEDFERLEQHGEVPLIRDGTEGYVKLRALTLRDLPAVLDTLVVLEARRDERDAG